MLWVSEGAAGAGEAPIMHDGKGRHMRSVWVASWSGVILGRARDSVTVVREGSDSGCLQARDRLGAPPCEVEARW